MKFSLRTVCNLYNFVVIWALLPQALAAYLDPGTGSMLFSAVLGFVSTAYFTLRSAMFTLRVKIAGLLGRMAAQTVTPQAAAATLASQSIVFFSEGKQYWNCFAPILAELERRQVAAAYWTMDPEDPAAGMGFRHVEVRFIGKGYTAFAQMNTLKADVCVMTAPGLDVLHVRRSKRVKHYCHIIHALDDCSTYRVFGTDYFDSVLLSGEHQLEVIEALESLRNIARKQKYIVGCTYLDVLQQKLDVLRQTAGIATKTPKEGPAAPTRLLVAPSWGPNALLAKFGMRLLGPLLDSGYQLIVRPHPQSTFSEGELLRDLRLQLGDYCAAQRLAPVHWDFERENLHSFLAADAMISDFSSVIYDYLILMARPVLIAEFDFNYDGYDAMDLLPREPWVIRAGRELGTVFDAGDIGRLDSVLRQSMDAVESGEFRRKLAELRRYVFQHPGEAGGRAADCILQIRASL